MEGTVSYLLMSSIINKAFNTFFSYANKTLLLNSDQSVYQKEIPCIFFF